MIHSLKRTALLAGLSLALVGCETGTGPGDAQTEVLLARGSAPAQSLATSVLEADARFSRLAAAGPVALGNVASIEMQITRVDALPAAADTSTEAAWVSLNVTAGGQVNLLALPTATEGGLTLARGELPAGTYGNVRFFVKDPTITFKEPVRVGRHTYPANEKIGLFIPSGEQTGLKTRISFTVGDAAAPDVKLIWDAAASVNRIVVTGAGMVILPPVLGGRVENGGD